MWTLLSTYAVPLIGSAILAAFAKPNKDKPPIWKRIVESVVKPSKPEELKLMPSLLRQLLNKKPPADGTLIPADDSQDLLTHILSLLSLPDDEKVVKPAVVEHGEIADLVACANAVSANNPDCDIQVVINETGVQVTKVKRAKVEASAK